MDTYTADKTRYDEMPYRFLGRTGLKVPAVSLGLWHNFGGTAAFETARAMVCKAFDLGITYFDLANNYGVPAGSAEESFGRIMQKDLARHRNEMIITTKAGHRMWEGPYGIGGSRKYLISSLDQSLAKMHIDYVDIFFSHVFDDTTPLEETLGALDTLVKQGKALYIGVSTGYNHERMQRVVKILEGLGTPCAVNMGGYNMFSRGLENGLQDFLHDNGIGCLAFSPLAQGLLTDKLLSGDAVGSRAAEVASAVCGGEDIRIVIDRLQKLTAIAQRRGQSLSQLAICWVLRSGKVQSAIIGARNVDQLAENAAAIKNLALSAEEITEIDAILAK